MRQGVIYGSVLLPYHDGQPVIDSAIRQLLALEDVVGEILWALRYNQLGHVGGKAVSELRPHGISERIISFPAASLELALDDSMIDDVRSVWKMVMGDDVNEDEFLKFGAREAADEEDGE